MGIVFNRTSLDGVYINSETLSFIRSYIEGFILGFFLSLIIGAIILLIIWVMKNDI